MEPQRFGPGLDNPADHIQLGCMAVEDMAAVHTVDRRPKAEWSKPVAGRAVFQVAEDTVAGKAVEQKDRQMPDCN